MIRRIAALLGIALIVMILLLLVWAVHLHRQSIFIADEGSSIVNVVP
ncbi:MAG TPA: hypothetical protein VMT00_01815 [Thermoanaerobaculia bacterium]|nr:hypothetical protein [Thermoanaerobaculia bacterium]